MKKPDVQAKIDELQDWVDAEVRPYILDLLNKAQRRIRTKIRFESNFDLMHFDGRHSTWRDSGWRQEQLQRLWEEGEEGDRFFRKFPEFFEIRRITREIYDAFELDMGEVVPTVQPWRKP